MKQKHITFYILILLILAANSVVYSDTGRASGWFYGGDPQIIRIYSPNGSYYNLGFEHGRLLSQMEKDVVPNIKKFINSERLYFNDMDPDYLIGILEKNLPKKYKDEMRGFADGIDSVKNGGAITYKDVLFMNLIGDVTRSRLMCSAVIIRGKDGIYAGRNFDWKDGGSFHRFSGITFFKAGKKSVASFGMTGVSSINTGLNKNGLFIAVLGAIQKKDAAFRGKDSVIFSVRYALEEAKNTGEALAILKNRQYPYSCIFLIADKNNAAFLEKSGKQSAVRFLGKGETEKLAATNHFLILKNDRKDEDSLIRYQDISAYMKKQKEKSGLHIAEAALSLCDNTSHPVYIRLCPERINRLSTLMSIVLKPGTNNIFIWFARKIPESEKPVFIKMDLKKYF
jgi:predicted choloylglycine hydrolase